MNVLKILGWVTLGGVLIGGAVGGAVWLYRRRKGKAVPGPTPSKPARKTEPADTNGRRNKPSFDYLDKSALGEALVADLSRLFGDVWPPDNATIDKLEPGDIVLFAAESKPTPDFDLAQQEIINAAVLSVEPTEVRARVIGPVAHTHHHGNYAGHGLYVGALIEVPRSRVLAFGRRNPPEIPTGYGSRGVAAAEFKPSDDTKQIYKVHPGTPYDLVLPYRTEDLHWYPNRDTVKFEQIGDKVLLHQIMFTEASVRGPYSVTVLDHDEKAGKVFVARWDFDLAE